MASVRLATRDDVPELIALGRVMHAEAPALRHAPFDEQKVEDALQLALVRGLVLVHIDQEGRIDGGFAGFVLERWFSREEVLSDLGLFVRPDRRGGLIAYRLVQALIEWCRIRGMKPENVVLGISTGVSPEKTGDFFNRLGFRPVGGNYQLEAY